VSALAHDPAVPQRDALLDPTTVAALLGAEPDRCARVYAKYRVGDSLRVGYRIAFAAGERYVAARTFRDDTDAYRRAKAFAVPAGPLPPVSHAPQFGTVLWAFPNDRRLTGLPLLAGRSPALDEVVGSAGVVPRLVGYAPERSATAECRDAEGRIVAFLKVHAAGGDERERRATEAAATDHPHLRVPRVLYASAREGALAIEPLPGSRLDTVPTGELGAALRRLGAGLAALHRLPAPAERFTRLDPERLARGVGVIARVRPDAAPAAAELLARLLARTADAAGAAVHLHGDANLRNALDDGERIALLDLEDASGGPAAADLGLVLGGLLLARVQDRISPSEEAALGDALLAGYGAPPPGAALRWHTAASVLARAALPAVSRVRADALARLPELLIAAAGRLT
jgi:aminoglycoside phosphotransferase